MNITILKGVYCSLLLSSSLLASVIELRIFSPFPIYDLNRCHTENEPSDTILITEKEMKNWDRNTGKWQLVGHEWYEVVDKCFILTLNHQAIGQGVVLSSYSARIIPFETLVLKNTPEGIEGHFLSRYPEKSKLLYQKEPN